MRPSPPLPSIDIDSLRHGRSRKLRQELAASGIDVAVLTNPVSIRYATDYRGYATFQSRIPSQYLIFPVDGPVVLHGAYTDELDTIDRCDVAHSVTSFDAGLNLNLAAQRFVADVERAVADAGFGSDAVIGIERSTPSGLEAFTAGGWNVVDAEPTIERCRSRKMPEELAVMAYAIAVAELGMWRMHDALKPGITENQLFAILHATNISHDGDWIDGRMLCSGPRTNPWYQEASNRTIERGDTVAFDTDMIGPFGYCADISRTWVCGGEPAPQQTDVYERAREEIEHNTSLLHAGASFRELSEATFRHPDQFVANRYACAFHGVGMTDEYPKIAYPQDWEWTGYDGELEEGTVLSVESFVGSSNGGEGVKLEQMVQVTTNGATPLSTFPFGLSQLWP